jgi:hypothetical protein
LLDGRRIGIAINDRDVRRRRHGGCHVDFLRDSGRQQRIHDDAVHLAGWKSRSAAGLD